MNVACCFQPQTTQDCVSLNSSNRRAPYETVATVAGASSSSAAGRAEAAFAAFTGDAGDGAAGDGASEASVALGPPAVPGLCANFEQLELSEVESRFK